MTTRRERAKAQNRKQMQLSAAGLKREKDEVRFEIGKYCFDLSKLAFGGVVLTNALHSEIDNARELGAGLTFMLGFLALGGILIHRAIKKFKV